ncbi:MAG: AAA family ATPase [Thermoleophilia bacterium]
MDVETLLSRLEAVKPVGPNKWMACCPAHDDREPSLSVAVGENGGIVLHDHAGCETDDILAKIGLSMADLMPPNGNGNHDAWTPRGDAVATYDYHDEHARLLYTVHRTADKQFPVSVPDATSKTGKRWKLGDTRRVLYNLPAVVAEVAARRTVGDDGETTPGTVLLIEGEKDVETARRLGIVATTAPFGASQPWLPEFSESLRSADVIVIPDNDAAGRKHMAEAAAALQGIAKSVTWLELPNLLEKGDLSDWVGSGGTADALERLAAEAKREGQTPPPADELPITTAGAFLARTPEKVDWLIDGLVARGSVTEVAAKIKTGKTTLIVEMVAAITRGQPFLGFASTRARALYMTEERPGTFRAVLVRGGIDGGDDLHILLQQDTPAGGWAEIAAPVIACCQRNTIDLVVIDTLGAWAGLGGDEENNAGAALAAMQPAIDMASAGLAVITSRHGRKSGGDIGDSARGSSAFGGSADILLDLRRPRGSGHPERRELACLSRFDESPNEIVIERQGGHYVCLGDATELAREQIREAVLEHTPVGEEVAQTVKEIVAAVGDDASESTVSNMLRDLASEHILARKKGVGSASSSAYGYWRTNDESSL